MRAGWVHCANENGVRNALEGSECVLILFHGGRVLRGEARMILRAQTEQPTSYPSLDFSSADGGLIGTVFAGDILQCPHLTCFKPLWQVHRGCRKAGENRSSGKTLGQEGMMDRRGQAITRGGSEGLESAGPGAE